jgi:hypothetical protein
LLKTACVTLLAALPTFSQANRIEPDGTGVSLAASAAPRALRAPIAPRDYVNLTVPSGTLFSLEKPGAARPAHVLPVARPGFDLSQLRLDVAWSPEPRIPTPWQDPPARSPNGASGPIRPVQPQPSIRWGRLAQDSFMFLAVQHAFRFTEEKTRREMDGPFFEDWFRAAGTWNGWSDKGKKFTNYFAHPLQGSVTAFIFAQNHRQSINARFGRNREYWAAKSKQFAFAFFSGVQFELGPISEASLGNVEQAAVDYVVTPTLGTAWSIGEDAMDHYFVRRMLQNHRVWGKFFACTLTPTRMVANLVAFRALWYRTPREGEP